MSQLFIAISMLFVVATLISLFVMYKRDASDRRLRGMLRKCGLDPKMVREQDFELIFKTVRNRCRTCESEDRCERWLEGEIGGGNEFCPNARLFQELKRRQES